MNLICGINPVLEALGAGTRHFDRLLVVKGLRNRRISEAVSRAGHLGIPLRFEARETLDRMAGGVPHQGLIAVVSAKPVTTVEKLLAEARTPALVVVLDGVEDPRNLGAILRTVEAAGADGVLLPDRHSAGLSETVNRASAGGLEHVRVASIGNVVQSIEELKKRGLWVVGFDAAGTERWDAVDYRRPIALVLGGEGRGIRRLVREHCDHLVSIPLFGHVGSLNVSVAAAVALYEVVRQRGAVPSHVRPIPARAPAGARVVGPGAEDAETDPGLVERQVEEEEDFEEDESQAEPIGLGEDEDRPAWAGPTVLKPVGPRREHAGRGGRHGPPHGHGRGQGRGQGRGHRRGPADLPPAPHERPGETRGGGPHGPARDEARGEERGGEHGAERAREHGDSPPPDTSSPHGPRGPRRRRRRGAGSRPGPGGGGPPADRPPRHEGGGPETAPQKGDAGPRPEGSEGHSAAPEGGSGGPPGGIDHRRRRRRRRH
jgi:23S rRNA (guanosine2251-2'-O)-methyltransferase